MFRKDVANVVRACLAKYIHKRLRAIDTLSGEAVLVLSIWQLWWFFAMADQVNDRVLVIVMALLAIVRSCCSERWGGFTNHFRSVQPRASLEKSTLSEKFRRQIAKSNGSRVRGFCHVRG